MKQYIYILESTDSKNNFFQAILSGKFTSKHNAKRQLIIRPLLLIYIYKETLEEN